MMAALLSAWILWQRDVNPKRWEPDAGLYPIGAWSTQRECTEQVEYEKRGVERLKKQGIASPDLVRLYTCFPDTFDPRPVGRYEVATETSPSGMTILLDTATG